MNSVTGRIKEIKQPRGGYIKPSEFDIIAIDDGQVLNEFENIHSSLVGLVVDYMTRFMLTGDKRDAFSVSLNGFVVAEKLGIESSIKIANNLLRNIKNLDVDSIINACKLVSFDVYYRSPSAGLMSNNYLSINPDKNTIRNIQILIDRSLKFLSEYGPVIQDGFTFEPIKKDERIYADMIKTGTGYYGGYTAVVSSGDGDFLTRDTLWDFKVSKSEITSKHTLQVLIYWIMGQHSGQEIYKNIDKIGIFNPRLNNIYQLEIKNISDEIIKIVEQDVICYQNQI